MAMDLSGRVPARPGRISDQGGLSTDQQLALKAAVGRFQREFHGVFDTSTIEHVLYASHDQFTGDSAIKRFMRAERLTRQRLRARARVKGHAVSNPVVVFLSLHDAGCSQMALGLASYLAEDRAVVWSGGSEPDEEINPLAVDAMRERGIDITAEFPKPWTSEIIQAADMVITMGCGEACPVFPGKRYLDWDIDDAAGPSIDAVRPVREEIERRVRAVLDELGVAVRD
jgi:arsenate reductase